MKIGINTESASHESRVAVSPDTVRKLAETGHEIAIHSGAGRRAGFIDRDYAGAGASILDSSNEIVRQSDLLLHVGAPSVTEITSMRSASAVVGVLNARRDQAIVESLAEAGSTAFAMELVPRIARAQSMDVLSSQASLAGYKAVLIAAHSIGKFFPMMMTAAGTIPPAQVLVIGAGVAGLQAIATAKRLGASVFAYDVRAAAAEQVNSLGARFIAPEGAEDAESAGGYARAQTADENKDQQNFLSPHIARADAVITTAAIPGRKAPTLITQQAITKMRAGSVIVDLAAESGGNTEATQPGEVVDVNGVQVHGPINVPASMPYHASSMYSRNIEALLKLIIDDTLKLNIDFDDEVIDAMCVTHAGEVRDHTISN